MGRGEAAVPVCACRLGLWVPHLLEACSSLVASSAHGLSGRSPLPSHTLRVQAAAGVRSVLGALPGSEAHYGLTEDTDSRASLGTCPCPWGPWGVLGPPHPSPPQIPSKGPDKDEVSLPPSHPCQM